MENKLVLQVNPVIDYSVRKICTRPYYRHPKGCPNYGKKTGCPPAAPYYDQVYDLSQPVFAICNVFNIRAHIVKMRTKHPEWSEYQLRCVLYWQGTARKMLKQHIIGFLKQNKGYRIEACPEAMGINITETMAQAGIKLEWPPQNIAYQIALAAVIAKKI